MKSLTKSTIFIIGLGQIGGSIGYDLVGKKITAGVIGFDKSISVMRTAKRLKAVDKTVGSPAKGIKEANIIILALPIRKMIKILPSICGLVDKNKIILDVGGTKSEIIKTILNHNANINIIGGHPIAGTEKEGIYGSKSSLFKKTVFVLTPIKGVKAEFVDVIKTLIKKLDATPLIMSPAEHDRLIAKTSQLPYALSLGLMNLAAKEGTKFRKLIGGSYKSATRVALSSPELTLDMFLTNKPEINLAIDKMIIELDKLKYLIGTGNEVELRTIINRAKKNREKIGDG